MVKKPFDISFVLVLPFRCDSKACFMEYVVQEETHHNGASKRFRRSFDQWQGRSQGTDSLVVLLPFDHGILSPLNCHLLRTIQQWTSWRCHGSQRCSNRGCRGDCKQHYDEFLNNEPNER